MRRGAQVGTIPSALLNSGAKENFLDAATAARWRDPTMTIERPLVACSLNGQNIGHITYCTVPLKLHVSSNHHKEIKLFLLDTPKSP